MQDQSSAGDSGLPGVKKLAGHRPLFKRQTSSAKKTETGYIFAAFCGHYPRFRPICGTMKNILNSYPRSQPPGP